MVWFVSANLGGRVLEDADLQAHFLSSRVTEGSQTSGKQREVKMIVKNWG